jgi:hypothetical protein
MTGIRVLGYLGFVKAYRRDLSWHCTVAAVKVAVEGEQEERVIVLMVHERILVLEMVA